MTLATPTPRRGQRHLRNPDAHWTPSEHAAQVLAQIGWDLEEKVPARPRCNQRDASVVELVICEDVTLDAAGQHFGLTRERIRQIVMLHTGMSTPDLAAYRDEMRDVLRRVEGVPLLHQAADADHNASTSDLARISGLERREVEQVRGLEESLRRRRKNTWTAQTVTDEQTLSEIARVASLPGGTPLTGTFYNANRSEGFIGSVRILQRFGTWREACNRAGAATNEPVRSSYDRRWSDEQFVDWAAAYIRATGTRATYNGMADWLRERADQGAPSAQSVRNEIGRWSDIRELALVRQRELDEGAELTIALG